MMNFWDLETPRFVIEKGPAWLKIDPAHGVLSGVPEAPGTYPVVVTVTLDREVRQLDPGMLSWGVEKQLSVTTMRAGADAQHFTIEVKP